MVVEEAKAYSGVVESRTSLRPHSHLLGHNQIPNIHDEISYISRLTNEISKILKQAWNQYCH